MNKERILMEIGYITGRTRGRLKYVSSILRSVPYIKKLKDKERLWDLATILEGETKELGDDFYKLLMDNKQNNDKEDAE